MWVEKYSINIAALTSSHFIQNYTRKGFGLQPSSAPRDRSILEIPTISHREELVKVTAMLRSIGSSRPAELCQRQGGHTARSHTFAMRSFSS